MDEREISIAALRISDPSRRKEYLEMICDENNELLDRVNSLIESMGQLIAPPELADLMTLDGPALSGNATGANSSTDNRSPDAKATSGIDTGTAAKTETIKSDSVDETLLRILQKLEQADSLGRLDNYEIKRVIGRGAFGIVLEAFDSKLLRSVAIKLMVPTLATAREESQKFLSEAQAVAAIRHENVVQIYSIEENPIPHLVMEYIPGKNLQSFVDEVGPLPLSDVLRIGQQIATGLDAAHQKGLVHRDIKPSNILIEQENDNLVKITDFGLARDINNISSTQWGLIVGTPMYMAPEQAEGDQIDQRSDLFSLGSVLYFMLTGRTPFQGTSAMTILNQVTREIPAPIQSIVPSVPDSICRIVTTLHSKNPENRYKTAREVADLLKQPLSEMKLQEFPPFVETPTPLATTRFGADTKITNSSISQDVEAPRNGQSRYGIALATIISSALITYFLMSTIGTKKPLHDSQTGLTSKKAEIEIGHDPLSRNRRATYSFDRLRSLLTHQGLAEGNFEDVRMENGIMTFDATDRSPKFWIDFSAIEGEEWTFSSAFRNLTPEQTGYIKVAFMPSNDREVSGVIGNWSGKSVGLIELLDLKQEDLKAEPLPLLDSGDWTDVKFVVDPNEFLLYVSDELIGRSPRKDHKRGHVALCVSGWRCQFKDPQVIMQYPSRSIPDQKPGGAAKEQ